MPKKKNIKGLTTRADQTLQQVEAACAAADARTQSLREVAGKAHDNLLRQKERLQHQMEEPADLKTRQAREDAYLRVCRRLTLAANARGVAESLKIGE